MMIYGMLFPHDSDVYIHTTNAFKHNIKKSHNTAQHRYIIHKCYIYLPNRGTASEVAGIVSATMLRKTVRDKRIVTPKYGGKEERKEYNVKIIISYFKFM